MTRGEGLAPHREKPYASLREEQSGDRDGDLTAKSPLEGWHRPAGIRLEDGWLVRELFLDRDNDVPVKPNRTLFDGFLKLATATDEQVHRFAQKWGFLFDMQQDRELVETWRTWASAGKTILDFAHELKRGHIPTDEMRAGLASAHRATDGRFGMEWPSQLAAREKVDSEKLALAVSWWLLLADT